MGIFDNLLTVSVFTVRTLGLKQNVCGVKSPMSLGLLSALGIVLTRQQHNTVTKIP